MFRQNSEIRTEPQQTAVSVLVIASMGGSNTKLTRGETEDYKSLTFLTEKEVDLCYTKFSKLLSEQQTAELKSPETLTINNPKFPVPISDLIEKLPELKQNPFARRMCQVFSRDQNKMFFEDFLDMMSVLSENAPTQVKAEWAFRIFDEDGDGRLDRKDILKVVRKMTLEDDQEGDEEDARSDREMQEDQLNKVVTMVIMETDINKSESISLVEFKQMVSKSHDFEDNFRIKL